MLSTWSPFLVFSTVSIISLALAMRALGYKIPSSPQLVVSESADRPAFSVVEQNFFLVILSLIAVLLLLQCSSPLDWDEVDRTSYLLLNQPLRVMNPLNTMHHVVSTFLSYSSISLFGYSKLVLRLPSVIISLGFFICLYCISLRFFTYRTLLLLVSHFVCNGLTLWYFHSMRGYALLLFNSAWLTYFCLIITLEKQCLSAKEQVIFVILFTINFLTHGFGGIFSGLLWISLLLWSLLNFKSLPSRLQIFLRRFLLLLFGILLAASFIYLFNLLCLMRTKFVMADKSQAEYSTIYLWNRFLMAFGSSRIWYLKMILPVLALYFIVKGSKGIKKSWLDIIVLSSVVVVGTLFFLLRVQVLEGRMVIWGVLPLLLMLASLPIRVQSFRLPYFLLLVTVFCLPQLENHSTLMPAEVSHFKNHEEFVDLLKDLLAPDSSVEFDGEPEAVFFAKNVYFFDRFNSHPESHKGKHYLLYFKRDQFNQEFDSRYLLEPDQFRLVLKDNRGRFLYERLNDARIRDLI